MVIKQLLWQEFIGEEVEVVASKNKSEVGICGKIIDETKSMLKIAVGDKVKTLFKKNITFKIKKTGQVVSGLSVAKRPEDRMKG